MAMVGIQKYKRNSDKQELGINQVYAVEKNIQKT
jgi:hypothetical protein